MLDLRRCTLLALLLFVAPMLAVAQEATPAPSCPAAEFPSAGALRLADGAVAWGACSPDEAYRTIIGASDRVVVVQESGPQGVDRHTIALDATDGSELWRQPIANMPIPPGPVDGQGIVVLATADRDAPAIVGVDAMTGEEHWRVASGDVPLAHSATVAVVLDWESFSNFSSGLFRGIDRATGDELWVSDTPLSDQSLWAGSVGRTPATVLGEVIVIPTGATVTAFDMRTGTALWSARSLDYLHAADEVIIGVRGANGPSSMVVAIDAVSGQQRWTAPGQLSYGGLIAVGDGVVAVLHSAGLVAYEVTSGNERWRVTKTTGAEPQLISGTSLLLLWEGELAVVSTTDGATVWSATQPFGSPLMNSVGSNGDTVFVAINSLPWGD